MERGITIAGYHLVPELRLRTTRVYTDFPVVDGPDGAMQRRIGSSMIDLHPNPNSGFRISAGLRFLEVSYIGRAYTENNNGLLAGPRLASSGGAATGFRRFTPAATVGYSLNVQDRMFIGVEGGTVLGRVNSGPPRGFDREQGRDPGAMSGGMNPVANMTFALKL
ncbi:hypothetical protein [Sphingomonas immobilis]|nr:hypothetical protein [Sphingomonas sp. CA1-15]